MTDAALCIASSSKLRCGYQKHVSVWENVCEGGTHVNMFEKSGGGAQSEWMPCVTSWLTIQKAPALLEGRSDPKEEFLEPFHVRSQFAVNSNRYTGLNIPC